MNHSTSDQSEFMAQEKLRNDFLLVNYELKNANNTGHRNSHAQTRCAADVAKELHPRIGRHFFVVHFTSFRY